MCWSGMLAGLLDGSASMGRSSGGEKDHTLDHISNRISKCNRLSLPPLPSDLLDLP